MTDAKMIVPQYSTLDKHSDNKTHPVVDRNLRKSFNFLNLSIYEESVNIDYKEYDDLLMEIIKSHDALKKTIVKEASKDAKIFFKDDKVIMIKELFGQVIREDVSQFLVQKLQKYVSDIGYNSSLVNADFVKKVANDFFKKVPEMHETFLKKDCEPSVLVKLSEFDQNGQK